MTDDEKLSSPSFEPMDAGYVMGSDATKFDATQIRPAPIEYITITLDLETGTSTTELPNTPGNTMTPGQLQVFALSGAVARAAIRNVGRARFSNAAAGAQTIIKPALWTVMPLGDGAPAATAPEVRTWSEYEGALKTLNRAQAKWQLVPTHELSN